MDRKSSTTRSGRRARRGRREKAERKLLERVHLNAAGIDVGSRSHWVAVPADRDPQPVREFQSVTHPLLELADWLEACGIDTVAMESTGVYWIPLYEILEERGFEVLLVNARHAKNVPGRKSDVLDCQWIQELHTFGLLRGSFRPEAEIVALRTLLRHRDKLVQDAAMYTQRMQKALTLMNVQLHHVISDVTGVTGMAILREIAAGETDPARLARHRDRRCKASEAEITAALTGSYREEHLFVLRQALEVYDFFREKLKRCDEEIEARLCSLESRCEPPTLSLPASRSRRRRQFQENAPSFEIRSPLYQLTGGVDITELPGIAPYGALKLISEIGLDMHRWPTEKHFVSWLTLAPRNEVSGGKLLASGTQLSANRAAKTFRMAAMTIGRSDHALGAFYRRLAVRVGKPKAITATARKIALLFYRMLKHKMSYIEIPASEYDERQRQRLLRTLAKRARSLGLDLVDVSTGLVM